MPDRCAKNADIFTARIGALPLRIAIRIGAIIRMRNCFGKAFRIGYRIGSVGQTPGDDDESRMGNHSMYRPNTHRFDLPVPEYRLEGFNLTEGDRTLQRVAGVL